MSNVIKLKCVVGKCYMIIENDIHKLSAPEINILIALYNKKNQPLSKEELMQSGWPGRIVTANSVIVAIANIRKTLRYHFTEEIIITGTGGYIYHSHINITKEGFDTRDSVSLHNKNQPLFFDDDYQMLSSEEDKVVTFENPLYHPTIEDKKVNFSHLLSGGIKLLFTTHCSLLSHVRIFLAIILFIFNMAFAFIYISDNYTMGYITVVRDKNWLTIALANTHLPDNTHPLSVKSVKINELNNYLKKINAENYLDTEGEGIKTYFPQVDGIISQCITSKGIVSSFLPQGIHNEACL